MRRNLDQTQMFDLMRWSARDIWKPHFDPDTGFGLLDLPAALSQEAPAPDPQEPNEDIYMIKANGLFRAAVPPLTKTGHGQATIAARLDYTEDPEDVYLCCPGPQDSDDTGRRRRRRQSRNVAAKHEDSVRTRRRATEYLIGASQRAGTSPDVISVRNGNNRGGVIFADVFLGEEASTSNYTLRVTTHK